MSKRSESTNKSAGQSLDFHPLYRQIKELLIQRVLRGDWRPGELLPSEFKLAAEFKVSQGTVRKALDEMAADKLVIRMQGKGTYVAGRGTRHTPLHFFRLTLDDGQWEPHNTRIVSLESTTATPQEAADLGLPAGGQVVRLKRVRMFEQWPMIYEAIALAASRFPDFEQVYRHEPRANLYALLEQNYGVLVVKAEEKLRAIAAGEEEARVMGLDPGMPLMLIERVSYGIDNAPVECRQMRCDTRRQYYASSLD